MVNVMLAILVKAWDEINEKDVDEEVKMILLWIRHTLKQKRHASWEACHAWLHPHYTRHTLKQKRHASWEECHAWLNYTALYLNELLHLGCRCRRVSKRDTTCASRRKCSKLGEISWVRYISYSHKHDKSTRMHVYTHTYHRNSHKIIPQHSNPPCT